jgi:hypothetical protein
VRAPVLNSHPGITLESGWSWYSTWPPCPTIWIVLRAEQQDLVGAKLRQIERHVLETDVAPGYLDAGQAAQRLRHGTN